MPQRRCDMRKINKILQRKSFSSPKKSIQFCSYEIVLYVSDTPVSNSRGLCPLEYVSVCLCVNMWAFTIVKVANISHVMLVEFEIEFCLLKCMCVGELKY